MARKKTKQESYGIRGIANSLYSAPFNAGARMAGYVFQNSVDSSSLEPTLIRDSGDTKIYAQVDSTNPLFYYVTVETRGQKQRAMFQRGEAQQYFDIPDEKIEIVEKAAIDKLFSLLGDGCRELLKLSMSGGENMRTIAEKLGFANENVAKSKNYRCKQRLKDLVGQVPELQEIL